MADVVQRASIEMAAKANDADTSKAIDTPGRELAFARERLSLSLEEIAQRTKIGVPYLHAIENDDVEKLPGHFYARGFLRAYAHEVHCDPEDIVRRFGIAPEEHAQNEPPVDESLHLHAPVELDDRRTARRLQLLALAVLVSGGFYVASGHPIHLPLSPRPAAAKIVAPAPTTAASVAVPAAVPTNGQAPPQTKPAASAAPLSVDVHADQESWLTATADGERVIYRTLSAGENTRIEAREEIVLRVGDAAAVSYAINGTAGRRLGASGEAVTIRVTPNNFREYLDSRPSTDHAGGGVL